MLRKVLKTDDEIREGDGLMALQLNPTFEQFSSFGYDIDVTQKELFSANDLRLWFSVYWRRPAFADCAQPIANILSDLADVQIVIPHQENTREMSWRQLLTDRQRLANFLTTDNIAQDRPKPTFQNWIFQVLFNIWGKKLTKCTIR